MTAVQAASSIVEISEGIKFTQLMEYSLATQGSSSESCFPSLRRLGRLARRFEDRTKVKKF
jgi:hypothetical protein